MNKENIFESVQNIFREVFDEEDLIIANETNSEDIEEWDSLNHINLVISIEKQFGIRFMTGELQLLKDVGEMIDLLDTKINRIT